MGDRSALLELCRDLGDPGRDLVLSAEGNVSMRIDDDTMAIKASGCSLAQMEPTDLVDVHIPTLLALLGTHPTDDQTRAAYADSVRSGAMRAPSVEAILHAALYDATSASVIAHTHPTAVNMIACSTRPELLVSGSLFPDAIVMLGRRQLLVPYTDPGVPLAEAVLSAVAEFRDSEGTDPKVVYLVNHGVFVLAHSPREALQVTEMCVKNARILHGTLAAGGPQFLSDAQVERIDSRPDEAVRRLAINAE